MSPINIGIFVFGLVIFLGGIGSLIKPNFIEYKKIPNNRFTQGYMLIIVALIIMVGSIIFQINI